MPIVAKQEAQTSGEPHHAYDQMRQVRKRNYQRSKPQASDDRHSPEVARKTLLSEAAEPYSVPRVCVARYLVWKNDGNAIGKPTHIYLQRLSADGLSLAGAAISLIRNTEVILCTTSQMPWYPDPNTKPDVNDQVMNVAGVGLMTSLKGAAIARSVAGVRLTMISVIGVVACISSAATVGCS